MDFIKFCSNVRGWFSSSVVCGERGISKNAPSSMKVLGWIETSRGNSRGSRWVGPSPKNDRDLYQMAISLVEAIRRKTGRCVQVIDDVGPTLFDKKGHGNRGPAKQQEQVVTFDMPKEPTRYFRVLWGLIDIRW